MNEQDFSQVSVLEAEVAELRGRLRCTAQIIIEAVGADGPLYADEAALKIVAENAELKRQRDGACAGAYAVDRVRHSVCTQLEQAYKRIKELEER